MKKSKSLSIIMSTLIAMQAGFNPAVFAVKPKIQSNLLKMLFYRRDLIGVIKESLPNSIPKERIPNFCQKFEFFNWLKENGIEVEEAEKSVAEKKEDSQSPEMQYIKQIIEEDNVELLQQETQKENNMNIIIEDSFFEVESMKIPILHYCAMKKAIKCFKFLILNGANPSLTLTDLDNKGRYKWDCMSVAAAFGELEMMKILEERGVNKLTNPSVWEAVALTHRNNILQLFISQKDEIGDVLFKECLQAGMKGVAKGNNLKGLKLLLSKGADINAKDDGGRPPLHTAAEHDAVQVAKLLISKGADINAKATFGSTTLHAAAKGNALQVAELLISKGADINAKDMFGSTPLHSAAENDAVKVAELLISKGVDINARDEIALFTMNVSNKTPLHIAAKHDANKVADLLISKGADVKARDGEGWTPLSYAAKFDAVKVAELLISKGADINEKGTLENTLLHIVACNNSVKVAGLLISKGADINAKNKCGMTPLWIAQKNGYKFIEQLLISKGAK